MARPRSAAETRELMKAFLAGRTREELLGDLVEHGREFHRGDVLVYDDLPLRKETRSRDPRS
jgi:hypothetical protein